jgi:3-hydroxybutyryl-CoA dehydrogenase
MVMPRILCMLINEAAFALTENTASAEDIDTAMKLGTNYPLGPIEWADRIGVVNVVAILKSLNDDLREERYRIAPVLSQLATGERWWNT